MIWHISKVTLNIFSLCSSPAQGAIALLLLFLGVPSCVDTRQSQTNASPNQMTTAISGTNVRLETLVNGGQVVITGQRLVATADVSSVTMAGDVRISLPALGTVSCDRIEFARDTQDISCKGHVLGTFSTNHIRVSNGLTR
ncbi:MAG: hypothetical protein JXR76_10550 [Deltaproteobacteria bacterium]|nr:hypothetical protein [Deltaproteobacteria bacterium]